MSDISRTVTIDLEYAEIIVLAHLLDRIQRGNGFSDFADDAAEVAALDSLTAVLEPKIVEAFDATYGSVLQASKARLAENVWRSLAGAAWHARDALVPRR